MKVHVTDGTTSRIWQTRLSVLDRTSPWRFTWDYKDGTTIFQLPFQLISCRSSTQSAGWATLCPHLEDGAGQRGAITALEPYGKGSYVLHLVRALRGLIEG